MNLSQRITNPLDDINTIKALIETFDNKNFYYSRIITYNKHLKNEETDMSTQEAYDNSMNKFSLFIFNKMKNNIVSTKNSLYMATTKDKEKFTMLQNFLKQIPDISTPQELYNIKKQLAKIHPDLVSLLDQLLGNRMEYWEVISSYIINQDWCKITPEHRLYINADYTNIFDIMTLFIKKCDQYNIPYYFKYDPLALRDDNIVIYSSSLYLDKYVAILEEVKNELQLNNLEKPPVLSGVIDGWIGYGSEPLDEESSFNTKRAKIIHAAIQKCTNDWISTHPNTTLYYNGQKIDIQNHLSTDYFLSTNSKNYLMPSIIMQNDNDFIMNVKNEIINMGKEQGIDPTNFAFDVENKKRLDLVETAINYFDSDITLRALPNVTSDRFNFFLQNEILNIICSNDTSIIQQVLEKIKQIFPNINFNNVSIYDVDIIENQTLSLCGNAIVIKNDENDSLDSFIIIGQNIEKCGSIPFKTNRKKDNRPKTI